MYTQEIIEGIQAVVSIIDPKDDYLKIVAAEEEMNLRAATRKKEVDKDYANLKALSRILEAARTSATRPPSVPSADEHADQLNQLDATRLTMAKAINDAEGVLASKEAELARLKEEVKALEESDSAAEHDLDGTMLKLQIYRGLGFKPVDAAVDGAGRVKMLVQSGSGDTHVVKVEEGRQENVELLWKLASS
ncbi:hypothetical protein FA95DRAFT_681289 [Auriscalpium vulgare]|uniref:Uncharacterized protein n=1 Tax=Auriscalpium vulgare TaxID=40419 RepID=A0ACB8RBJ0_9AGAM|nr:hypothetical protein FA95DRAFT_681289 [Auriscalpium vulgare]